MTGIAVRAGRDRRAEASFPPDEALAERANDFPAIRRDAVVVAVVDGPS